MKKKLLPTIMKNKISFPVSVKLKSVFLSYEAEFGSFAERKNIPQ